jgi:ParB-like chromosome segregation protein Spo0J
VNEHFEVPAQDVVAVPILSLRPGYSPRREGESKAHIARLAESETPLPPILVDRRTMRVIDGMHRLMAASLRGQETIDVKFFDGSEAAAFVLAVQANVTHGLPLSRADRRAAAARIIASHPQMSDRAIGTAAGLAAGTVAAIRRGAAGGAPELAARVGKDGRVRPVNGAHGRERAAALLAERPGASLREVARGAGVSPGTVRDVRRRLKRGEEPAPAPAVALEQLLRDPSLRHNEQGRRLLRSLQANSAAAQMWPGMTAAVPPHCVAIVMQLARQYGQMWLGFAQELDERARIIDP